MKVKVVTSGFHFTRNGGGFECERRVEIPILWRESERMSFKVMKGEKKMCAGAIDLTVVLET